MKILRIGLVLGVFLIGTAFAQQPPWPTNDQMMDLVNRGAIFEQLIQTGALQLNTWPPAMQRFVWLAIQTKQAHVAGQPQAAVQAYHAAVAVQAQVQQELAAIQAQQPKATPAPTPNIGTMPQTGGRTLTGNQAFDIMDLTPQNFSMQGILQGLKQLTPEQEAEIQRRNQMLEGQVRAREFGQHVRESNQAVQQGVEARQERTRLHQRAQTLEQEFRAGNFAHVEEYTQIQRRLEHHR
jgi:hypothetical protein